MRWPLVIDTTVPRDTHHLCLRGSIDVGQLEILGQCVLRKCDGSFSRSIVVFSTKPFITMYLGV
jgi:hypothetical protein